jgi:hypothetical protein
VKIVCAARWAIHTAHNLPLAEHLAPRLRQEVPEVESLEGGTLLTRGSRKRSHAMADPQY